MGLVPHAPAAASPEVMSHYVEYARGPLRTWFWIFSAASFLMALFSVPIWATVVLFTTIGAVLIILGFWVHFTLPGPSPDLPSVPRAGSRRRRMLAPKWVAVLVAIGAVLIILGLATVPIEHSCSATIPASFYLGPGNGWGLSFPGAERVSGAWSTSNGEIVLVKMTTGSSSTVYEENGSSGSFSFTQTAVLVFVIAPANSTASVSVTAYYWSPYWTAFW